MYYNHLKKKFELITEILRYYENKVLIRYYCEVKVWQKCGYQ
jgi:hypothetical protein